MTQQPGNKTKREKEKVENEWWKGACIYQIYPRSFYDSCGDGVGDLPGITDKLDYVAELGVDGVWISPFFTSPMKDFGYDVADYRDVDPMFGTLDDFKKLLHKAHALNLKIIIDLVLSHTSDQHPWFTDKPEYYVWADPKPDMFGERPDHDEVRKNREIHRVDREPFPYGRPSAPRSASPVVSQKGWIKPRRRG